MEVLYLIYIHLINVNAFLFHKLKQFTFKHMPTSGVHGILLQGFAQRSCIVEKVKYLCLSLSPAGWFLILLLEVVKAHYAWTVTARRQSIKIAWRACDSKLSSSELLSKTQATVFHNPMWKRWQKAGWGSSSTKLSTFPSFIWVRGFDFLNLGKLLPQLWR